MKPSYLLIAAGLLSPAVPAHSAFVLGPQTCNDPYRSGQSLAFAHRSYLGRSAQLAQQAQQRFKLDKTVALDTLQQRYPALGLATLRVRVIRCTVYYEAEGCAQNYLFDAQTLQRIHKERP